MLYCQCHQADRRLQAGTGSPMDYSPTADRRPWDALPAWERHVPSMLVLLVGLLQAAWLIAHGLPCITSDHAVYHSPAVEWITRGKL
ncbi:MAG TPA: hypothetical protein PKA06_07205, partial [Gemmatales bacterium]|nr:hypothetical protein [Gemmatales bacterium]